MADVDEKTGKKFLDISVLNYAITSLGQKINATFMKIKDEITETRIDEIMAEVFDKKEE